MDVLNTKIKNILTEKTNKIRPENIKKDVNILGITGTYEGQKPSGEIEILENGQVDVSNYASANVNVPIPTPSLQNKSVTITENGTQTITADSGYDGLNEVEVTTNVSGSIEGEYALLDFTGFTGLNFTYGIKEISDLDLSTITNCNNAFSNFGKLQKVGKLKNSSKVTQMSNMFYYCRELVDLDLSDFNTSNVTNMAYMFYYCSLLTSLDLSTFNTSNVTNFTGIFSGCSGLTKLNLSTFNTSRTTIMTGMFAGCSNLITITFGNNFILNKCTSSSSLSNMFQNCSNLDAETLNAILGILITFGGTSNKTLNYIGLTSAQATTCQTLSNWSAAEAAGWTTGY